VTIEGSFPQDRRDGLFGREPAIEMLMERVNQPGVTALVARPLMGKTWALEEVARRLIYEQQHMVGYHESKASDSHMLRTVADLYRRWLADSTMREQFVSMWDRHKKGLIPRLGKLVGGLVDLAKDTLVPAALGSAIHNGFDGLAQAHQDLETGGVQLRPLQYEEACGLARLVNEISGASSSSWTPGKSRLR
jgi:hypothetical protein